MHRLTLVACFALCACEDGCGRRRAPVAGSEGAPPALAATAPQVLAYLENVVAATTRTPEGGVASVAAAGAPLLANDLVRTDATGEADVVFAGNNRVHLGHDGALLLHGMGATATEVGAVLLEGKAQARGGGGGVTLNIGTPLGMAKMAADQISVLEVDLGKGLRLTTGEVNLVRPDQLQMLPLTLGQTLEVGALPLLLPGQQMVEVPGITVQNQAPPPPPGLVAHVVHHEGSPERQASGQRAWHKVVAGEPLRNGDILRLGPQDRAAVALADGMDVALDGNSELVLGKIDDAAQGRRARFGLARGHARLQIHTLEGRPAQEATVAGVILQVAPGAREAKVDVDSAGADGAHVVVRYGVAKLGERTVEAGQAIDVRQGMAGQPYAAFEQPVALTAGKAAVVYVGTQVPPFQFGAGGAGGPHHVEMSPNDDFSQIVAAEDTASAPLRSDELGLGIHYWRPGADGSPKAKVEVRAEPKRHRCGSCARSEAVDDTGTQSTILYQHELPRVTLRWSSVDDAAGYQVRLAPDDAALNVLVDKVVRGTELDLPSDTLHGGAFRWSVTPVDLSGQPLATSKENLLRLALDNVTRGLSIRSPETGSHTRASVLTTVGEVELGSTLSINGRPQKLTDEGQFSARLALGPGLNRLVYVVATQGRADRIYLRDVVRDASVPNRLPARRVSRRRAR